MLPLPISKVNQMKTTNKTCSGPITRRSFLEVGSLMLGGLGLSDLLRLRAEAKETERSADQTSVILIWHRPCRAQPFALAFSLAQVHAPAMPGMNPGTTVPANKQNITRPRSLHRFASNSAFLSGHDPAMAAVGQSRRSGAAAEASWPGGALLGPGLRSWLVL